MSQSKGQQAQPPTTPPGPLLATVDPDVLRAAVREGIADFFAETVAPLISLLDGRSGVARWLEAWPNRMPPLPPAGTWVRAEGRVRTPTVRNEWAEVWHLSSGEGDQPLDGRARRWYRVKPACGWRRAVVVDVDVRDSDPVTRRLTTRRTRPESDACPRCLAIAERTVTA